MITLDLKPKMSFIPRHTSSAIYLLKKIVHAEDISVDRWKRTWFSLCKDVHDA